VVPAAGRSERMGRPKLLLALGGKTVIAHLLNLLDRDDVTARFVVLRADDEALRTEVAAATATIVQPRIAPADMRKSVEHALDEIGRQHSPDPDDGWLLLPADHPMLEPGVLDVLIRRWNERDDRILVPTHGGRRGHPTFFRWELAGEVPQIPPSQGLNELLETHRNEVVEFAIDDPAVVTDLDTPDDYEALVRRWS